MDRSTSVTALLARQQAILRSGKPSVDVAILRHSFWDDGHSKFSKGFDYWTDEGLDKAGFTHEYISPALLASRQWTVGGGAAVPQGPSYRAIVVMPRQALPLSALNALSKSARAGVLLFIVGDLPTAFGPDQERAMFGRKLAELRTIANVHFVAEARTLPEVMAKSGLAPRIDLGSRNALQIVTRRLERGSYIWLHNPTSQAIVQSASTRTRSLAIVDLLTGKSTPMAVQAAGHASWTVRLEPGEVAAYVTKN